MQCTDLSLRLVWCLVSRHKLHHPRRTTHLQQQQGQYNKSTNHCATITEQWLEQKLAYASTSCAGFFLRQHKAPLAPATAQCHTVLYHPVESTSILHCTALHCPVQYRIAPHSTVLSYTGSRDGAHQDKRPITGGWQGLLEQIWSHISGSALPPIRWAGLVDQTVHLRHAAQESTVLYGITQEQCRDAVALAHQQDWQQEGAPEARHRSCRKHNQWDWYSRENSTASLSSDMRTELLYSIRLHGGVLRYLEVGVPGRIVLKQAL